MSSLTGSQKNCVLPSKQSDIITMFEIVLYISSFSTSDPYQALKLYTYVLNIILCGQFAPMYLSYMLMTRVCMESFLW